jgi:hypothetical protein
MQKFDLTNPGMVTQTLKYEIIPLDLRGTKYDTSFWNNVVLMIISTICLVSLIRGMVELDSFYDIIWSFYG